MSKEERNNQPEKPYALCVTHYHHEIKIWTINAYEIDELTASFDDGEIKKFKIQEDKEGRSYFTIRGYRVYLDECVRYGTPWLSRI